MNEGAGQVVLTVTLDRSADPDPGDEVTVQYKTLSGTATGSRDADASHPADYSDQEGTLTFTAGETQKTFAVPILEDTIVENPEDFTAILFNPISGDKKRYGTPIISDATATVTIVDNDIGSTVRFEPTDYTVAEQPGNSTVDVVVRARRVGDPNKTITVEYATSDGTATAGSDYKKAAGEVTFGPGETEQKIQITVLDDVLLEDSENFFVTLSNPSGATLDPSGGSVATVNIADNDSGTSTVQFGSATYRVVEGGGSVAIKVTRSGGIGLVVSASYSTADRTATSGSDYSAQSGTISFASGQTETTINIPVKQDALLEPDETFTVALSSPSAGAKLGTPSKTTVTILDDDANGNKVQFSPTTYTAAERPGNTSAALTVTVTRTGDPNTTISVQYATRDGSATAGSFDYTPSSGTITFGPGETQATIFVTVLDDNLIENPENFFVVLSNATNAGIDANSGQTATITIADDDSGTSKIQFSAASYTTSESAGRATLTVVRSGGLGFAVSVRYDTANDTAQAGLDYTSSSSIVSFAPGEYQKVIGIPIIDDTKPEPPESFSVVLSSPRGNATIGSPGSATVTIADNDNPPPQDNSTKLINLSTRGPVGGGDDLMIGGFIIQGNSSKVLVLRAIGPSMAALGVANAVSDPTLTLTDANGMELESNDDYTSAPSDEQQVLTRTKLTPDDTRESAIVTTLGPGAYTAMLRGKSSGAALVEVYDISSSLSTKLVNISTRGKVEQDDSGAMIAGFIIGAPGTQAGVAQRVVIRAIGPSLKERGVADALGDTTLEIYHGGQKILSNDDWKSNSTEDQQALQAAGIAPTNDQESAVITTLAPGSYSAVIRGKDNGTGVALAEVYQVNQ